MLKKQEKWTLLLIYVAVFIALAIHPRERDTWALENSVPFLELMAVLIYYRWVELSRLSYYLILGHLIIQMIGGHYTYAEVPLFNWIRDALGDSRNQYDRVAHFLLGFLLYIPIREICLRRTPLFASPRWATSFSITTIAAVGGLWEVFEWLVAVTAYPELGTQYLGLQGDVWDPQKDIILAVIGAVAAQAVFASRHEKGIQELPRKRYDMGQHTQGNA